MAELWIYNKEQRWRWWWWGEGDHSKIKLQKNRFKNILFKAGATDERDAVVCVWFEFPIRHILFRMALTTIETHLLYTDSTVPPLLLLDISSLRKERKWSDATPALWYLVRDKYSPQSVRPIIRQRKAKLVMWSFSYIDIIRYVLYCLLLLPVLTFRITVRQTVELKQVEGRERERRK